MMSIVGRKIFQKQFSIFKFPFVNYSKDPLTKSEAPIVENSKILNDKVEEEKEKLSNLVSLPKEIDLSPINGIPDEHVKTRRVRIFIPPKNAMQSGTANTHCWQIEFDNRERWENNLIGWSSSGDPLSNIVVDFNTKEEAINHCEKNGWKWFVSSHEKPKKENDPKIYAEIFSWNKRTRASTK